jgi:hypothetical protein
MKKTILLLLIGMAMIATGCNSNTYSRLRDKEDKLIKNYLSRNNINVLTEEPDEDYVWGEKDYYKVSGYDDLYFHLRKQGDTTYTVKVNDVIVARYKKFELTEDPDTVSYWTTLDQAFPREFHYQNGAECECVGWHVAVKLMKYADAQCEIIVPSKLGFTEDQTSVTPYVYILKIKVKQ